MRGTHRTRGLMTLGSMATRMPRAVRIHANQPLVRNSASGYWISRAESRKLVAPCWTPAGTVIQPAQFHHFCKRRGEHSKRRTIDGDKNSQQSSNLETAPILDRRGNNSNNRCLQRQEAPPQSRPWRATQWWKSRPPWSSWKRMTGARRCSWQR